MISRLTQKMSVKMVLLANLVLGVLLLIAFFQLMQQQRQRVEGQLLEKEKVYSQIGAKAVGQIIDEAISNGQFRVGDFFDPEYVPIPGTSPQQYHTRYDGYFDGTIKELEKEFARDPSVFFAVAVDSNGYMPTSANERSDALVKQIVNDKQALQAAKGKEVGFFQSYRGADGEIKWDISSPITVKNRHWGAFRIHALPAQLSGEVASYRASLIRTLLFIFFVSVIASWLIVLQVLKPLNGITLQAAILADGNLDSPVDSQGLGELANLAESLERLRVSMKVAMERLYR